jgi:Isy1-like splicing family
MRKRHSLCSTASVRPRQLSLVSERAAIDAHAWQVRARACENVSDGEEKYYARSVGKCRKFRMVCDRFVLVSKVILRSPCTAGLTDYEVRDLNDEINKLMREKRHWENQIIALGGANYRRNVAMLDDDGREVPGTKGYKCVVLPPVTSFAFLI